MEYLFFINFWEIHSHWCLFFGNFISIDVYFFGNFISKGVYFFAKGEGPAGVVSHDVTAKEPQSKVVNKFSSFWLYLGNVQPKSIFSEDKRTRRSWCLFFCEGTGRWLTGPLPPPRGSSYGV